MPYTRPSSQDQDQDQDECYKTKTKTEFDWSKTGLATRPKSQTTSLYHTVPFYASQSWTSILKCTKECRDKSCCTLKRGQQLLQRFPDDRSVRNVLNVLLYVAPTIVVHFSHAMFAAEYML